MGGPHCLAGQGAQAWGSPPKETPEARAAGVAVGVSGGEPTAHAGPAPRSGQAGIPPIPVSVPGQDRDQERPSPYLGILGESQAPASVQACTFRKNPDIRKPVMSRALKPCLVAPVYPGMKDVGDPWFLERPGSLSRPNEDCRQYAAPRLRVTHRVWATLPPGDVQVVGARPSCTGLEGPGCSRLAERVCTGLAKGAVQGGQGSESHPGSGEARSPERVLVGNRHLPNSAS